MRFSSKIETFLTKQMFKMERRQRLLKLNNLKISKQDLTLFLNSYQLIQVSLLLLKLNPNHNSNSKKHRHPLRTRVTVFSSILAHRKTNRPLQILISILTTFFQINLIPSMHNQKLRKQLKICFSLILHHL